MTIGLTGVSAYITGVHLDVIVTLQSPVGIVHALDCAGQDIERNRALVRGDWSRFQPSAPGIRKDDGTIRREGGIRNDLIERGKREIEFCGNWLEEFSVNIHHFRDRAEEMRVNSNLEEGGEGLPIRRNTVVDNCPGFLRKSIPDREHLAMNSYGTHLLTL